MSLLCQFTGLLLVVFFGQMFVCLSYPYEGSDANLDEGYSKIKAGILNRKRSIENEDFTKEFQAMDKFYNDVKENGLNKKEDLIRLRREETQNLPSIEKCCEVIKEYIDKKKDAHDVLCSESDLEECCNDFADEIKKQEDAYDVLCATNERNECESSPCDEMATCKNTLSSFTCTCNEGYGGDGLQCTDLDSCGPGRCHDLAECHDNSGIVTCTCDEGYTGDGETSCTAILKEFQIYTEAGKECLVNSNELSTGQCMGSPFDHWSWTDNEQLKNSADHKCITAGNLKLAEKVSLAMCHPQNAKQKWFCRGKHVTLKNTTYSLNNGYLGIDYLVVSNSMSPTEWTVNRENVNICVGRKPM